MSIARTKEWFDIAVPSPTDDSMHIQVACHLEEIGEMLATMGGMDESSDLDIRLLQERIEAFSNAMKAKEIRFWIKDRKEYLDSIADQIVTGVGNAHMAKMDIVTALDRVNESNFSKFDENGKPIFNEQGKIMKNPLTYKPVDLTDLAYPQEG